MPERKQMKEDKMTGTARVPFFAAPFERDALYDGIAFGHYLGRVLAKRLFKAGV